MPKRTSKTSKTAKKAAKKTTSRKDSNQIAFATKERTIEISEADTVASPVMDDAAIKRFMAEMGRKGGKIGGKNRMAALSPAEKTQLALKAAKARWAKEKGDKA